ncbi:MAG: hypothetical protein HC897_19975 [Thermoanaerobaculia bacterium]|nr:hypothetical protein [Thermoanaerobaculia bacterium]
MGALIGIDIGQTHDPTAIAVVEEQNRREGDRTETHYLVRSLERLPLGTPYPQVVRRLHQIITAVYQRTGHRPIVYLDATGVGTPILDMLRENAVRSCDLRAVYITHGERCKQEKRGDYTRVVLGKALLVCRLQALLSTGRLHLPRTPDAEALAVELLNYEIRVDENATDRYGAFRVGTHDDLATAVGLAVQVDRRSAA